MSYNIQLPKKGLGWIPDVPNVDDLTVSDVRDTLPHELLNTLGRSNPNKALPKEVDNRKWNSPVDDQGNLGSCTANASMSMMEYMEKKAFGTYIEGSRLFTYWNTRKMMGSQYVDVDSGAYNRTAVKSVIKYGIIPEELWPYDESTFKNPPSLDMFLNPQPYKAASYLRLDTDYGVNYVNRMKTFLSSGYALFTGFVAYDNFWNVSREKPVLDYPVKGVNKQIGGHAVMICGYANDINYNLGQGAFLIKNSYGPDWGMDGYFWIPYKYFENGIAVDTWCVNKLQYVESKQFD